ncbi:DUF1772 domain-containing protein [Gandjariella thermophila]|uniref:DUF1772 domain-containing protein n=1 Tax=Gandjariella thermophila TaxID=1931992 RepID=A0A4D4JBD6_9PSEU|nr:DUF1772 domain-containing protein [Gandjariella thermophila]GDY31746.1 hypothetical protein GTS_33790 [Gandjariella thermophila]
MRPERRTPVPKNSSTSAETRLLEAFLAATGFALGAGLFEIRVVIPQWAAVPTPKELPAAMERSGHVASGKAFWPFVGATVLPLTAANLVAALRCRGPRRPWWLASSATMAATTVATATYYVPTLHRLMAAEELPEEKVRAMVRWRVRLDYVRLAVGIGGWFAGLRALSRS